MPASGPERFAEVLKRPDMSAFRSCAVGFLQEHYGNSFAARVFSVLATSGTVAAARVPKSEGKIIQRFRSNEGAQPKTEQEVSVTGPGNRLDPRTRSYMESGMRRSFDRVRIHTDNQAAAHAANLNAQAFTLGSDVFFAAGKYRPDSLEGKKLLAHELVHVTQGGTARGVSVNNHSPSHLPVSQPHDPLERQADQVAAAVVRGGSASLPVSALGSRKIYRKGADEEEEKAGWLAEKVAGYAANIPGFTLVSYVLGRNPITGKPVERTAKNLLGGLLGMVPGGALVFKNLDESGAIDSAFTWVSEKIQAMNITWEGVKALLKQAWDELSIWNGIEKNLAILVKIFAPTYEKLKNFALATGEKILHFIFEGALRLIGADPAKIMAMFNKAGDALKLIVADPVRFLKNLLAALGKGFNQFSAKIWEHLKTGLMGWLFGALEGAGITIPKSFDLKSIFGLVLEVLGITKAFIRKKVAKVIGEKNLELIEKAWGFIATLISSGVAGLWEMLKEHVGNLKEMVLGAIQDWVVTKIVTAAITKLVSMFNPVGAIITAVQTIYNTVMFFIERIKQIMALVDAIVQSVFSIAQGAIDKAANWVEQAMARTLPVIISFLARLIGLGGISEKIKGVIKNLQERVDKAVDKVIDNVAKRVKGVVGKGLELFSKGKAAATKGVAKLRSVFLFSFKMGKTSHNLYTETIAGKHIVMMSSNNPGSLISKIKSAIGKCQENNLKNELKTFLQETMDIESALAKNPDKKEEQRLNQKLSSLSVRLQKFGKDNDLDDLIPIADDDNEGNVDTYGTLKGQGVEMTPDHEPQNSVMSSLKKLTLQIKNKKVKVFSGTSLMSYSTSKGICLNMKRSRHLETRTYGPSGKKTKNETLKNMNVNIDTMEFERTSVLDIPSAINLTKKSIIKALEDDHKKVKEIYDNKKWKIGPKIMLKIKDYYSKVKTQNESSWPEIF